MKFVPLEPELYRYLKNRRKTEGFVIEEKGYGERMTVSWFLNKFKKYLREAGLPGSPHALRHSYASQLVMAGVPIYTVSKLLGHKSVKTSEIYSHLGEEHLSEAVKSLPKLRKTRT